MGKVVLPERATKEVVLPSCGATVVIYSSLLLRDFEGIDFDKKNIDSGIKILSKLIKSWDIYNSEQDNEPLPINDDSVGRLSTEDLTFLMGEVEKFASSEKKR